MEENLSAARSIPGDSRTSRRLKLTRYYVSPNHSIFSVLSKARENGNQGPTCVTPFSVCHHAGALCEFRAPSQFANAMAIVTRRMLPSARLILDATKTAKKTPSAAIKLPAGSR
jgi:hypothetical protein